jgi:ABC-type dipeptide/oligopeptide/nickel transport system permease subunit
MLGSLLGVAVGGGLGFWLYTLVYKVYEKAAGMPGLSLAAFLVLIGGGVIGGGYVALWLTTRIQKARKAKARTRRAQKKFQPKKKPRR